MLDERFIPVKTNVLIEIRELYPIFQSAYGVDEEDGRYILNNRTQGITFDELKVGQILSCSVSKFFYVIQCEIA